MTTELSVPLPAADASHDDLALLNELEPEAARLFDRHVKVAQEWFPHDYIPYRLGRDFDKEPWTPDQPRLTGVAQTAFEVNLLTEDNLPSYHRLIHGMFGDGDGAWINWIGRWTAEEGRHAIVLRDYLTVTRNLDPIALERGRMTQLQQGYDRDTIDTLRGLAYVAFQELATRISHRNTGRYSRGPGGRQDHDSHRGRREPPHGLLPRHPRRRAEDPAVAGRAGDRRRGPRVPDAGRRASQASSARPRRSPRPASTTSGSTATRCCCPILRHWRIFELEGLDAAAEDARRRLAEHLETLDQAAKRFEEKMATSTTPRIARAG